MVATGGTHSCSADETDPAAARFSTPHPHGLSGTKLTTTNQPNGLYATDPAPALCNIPRHPPSLIPMALPSALTEAAAPHSLLDTAVVHVINLWLRHLLVRLFASLRE
mmetsp:Transcript_101383/g.171613  ORF Transcript_101383/g.171613 Transcript_101383/m.171613 type:complete len:108 (-) Transcript_101383:409-732(-)